MRLAGLAGWLPRPCIAAERLLVPEGCPLIGGKLVWDVHDYAIYAHLTAMN